MSTPLRIRDPAVAAVGMVIGALTDAYSATSSFPPENPASAVRFFAGEGFAPATWNAHTEHHGCDEPFVWVRVQRRYRTEALPSPSTDPNLCKQQRAVAVEVGVARCAVVELEPSWADYEAEGVLSLEDSWRIETALCVAAARLRADDYVVSTEEIAPYGPEGGIIAWTGVIHIQFD